MSGDAGDAGAAAAPPLPLFSLLTLSNLHLRPGIRPLLRPPLSTLPWCSFPPGHVQNLQLLLFLFQVLLREEFTFEAPFWRGALSFSSVPSLLTWTKYRLSAYQTRARGPWDRFMHACHCPRDTAPSPTLRRCLSLLNPNHHTFLYNEFSRIPTLFCCNGFDLSSGSNL